MKQLQLGFIGCGHMGMAIARGAVRSKVLKASEIGIYDTREEIMQVCKEEGFVLLESEVDVAKQAHMVLLGVRPQVCDEVLEKLKDTQIDVLLSIVTGYSIAYIQEKLNHVPMIRTMPNTPLQINYGSIAICPSDNCAPEDVQFVISLFEKMGICKMVKEEQIDTLMCAHGSTPAYFYYYVKCMMDDLMKRGIEEDVAREFLVQTMIGSGFLMQENPEKPLQAFIDEVCSPGGTTIEAIGHFKQSDFETILQEANEKCIARGKELGK